MRAAHRVASCEGMAQWLGLVAFKVAGCLLLRQDVPEGALEAAQAHLQPEEVMDVTINAIDALF